jgi:hypothetical protein
MLKNQFKTPNFSLVERHALGQIPQYFQTSAQAVNAGQSNTVEYKN